MADFKAKAKEIVEVWDGEAEIDAETMIAAIATALAEADAMAREDCAQKLDVLVDMTTEPQASAYRFAAYRIRPRGAKPESSQ